MSRSIYKDSNGKRVPSVTTIISRFKESGGLLYWANQQGLDGKTLEEARMPATTAGTLAHEMVEAHINGRPVPDTSLDSYAAVPGDVLEKALAAYEVYKKWQSQTALTIRHTEVALVSDKHRFGGRLDAIGQVPGDELTLVDWKTSNSVYGDYLLQLAAYGLLWEENYPDHKLTGFHLCRFAKEEGDFSHHYYPSLEHEAATFLTLRGLYDDMKKIDKRAR